MLVIDDEVEIRNGKEDIFRANGCDVVVAEGVDSAFDELQVRALEPDIVIADHRLERGETGAYVIEAIRKRFNRSIPGVIVTGDTASERMREASRSGFAFLHEPAAPAELVRVVADLLD